MSVRIKWDFLKNPVMHPSPGSTDVHCGTYSLPEAAHITQSQPFWLQVVQRGLNDLTSVMPLEMWHSMTPSQPLLERLGGQEPGSSPKPIRGELAGWVRLSTPVLELLAPMILGLSGVQEAERTCPRQVPLCADPATQSHPHLLQWGIPPVLGQGKQLRSFNVFLILAFSS